ncbi:hypothetical protein OIE78_34280 (plasmid) [Streptomyces cellulosae]|uniref:hypothetical protein n=1 Tax=Streptomyces cellulosae TaxID=1968 RepID=UPI002F90DCB6|nr:hypothetical protein OG837_35935 [Streptomyces cellulosae]
MSTAHDPRPRDLRVDDGEHGAAAPVDEAETLTGDDGQDSGERTTSAAAGRCAHYALTVFRVVSGHTGPGLRHGWDALMHWTTVAYMSDEEIRRRLVKKHLDTYIADRETARSNIDRLSKKTSKMAREAVHFGLTPEEAGRLRETNTELQRRRRAGTALARIPFDVEAAQPTEGQIRRHRTVQSLARFAGVLLPAGAATIGLVLAAPTAGLIALPLLAGAAWWLGRHPVELTQRPLPADLVGPPELEPLVLDTDDDPDTTELEQEEGPYAIANATTPEEAEEALRRAITHEGGDVESVTDARHEPWGWSVRVTFRTGSPDDLNKEDTYKGLVTLLRVRRNGLLIEGDPDDGASCTVRVLIRDPFAAELVGDVPYRAPLSASITDVFDFGVAMDATPLAYALAGLMLLMVADSGGGKSGIMLAMAEAVTSTRDAVVINVDPVGTGVDALGPAITLSACMDDDTICAVLEFFLALCSARARQRAKYGWGNLWRVSPEHPAFCLFVDEWPQLSNRAKALLIRLLLLGRKEAIWVYGGSQYGTKDYLGEAIGPKLSAKLIGASRRVDVTELLGSGALAEGYRADLIRPATHNARNDAGQMYAQGLPGMPDRPMRYQVREILPDYAARVGAERAAAGLPDVTHTLAEAGMLDAWLELQEACQNITLMPTTRARAPEILLTIRDAFSREDDPAYVTLDQLHSHLRRAAPELWGRWDGLANRDRLRELGKALRRALDEADVALSSQRISELDGTPRGFYLTDVQEALDNAT